MLLPMWYVYVLISKKDFNTYIGSSNDLRRRFKEHNSGKVQSTRHRKPFALAYYEAYYAEDDAREREKQLKRRGRARSHLMRRIEESIRLLRHEN